MRVPMRTVRWLAVATVLTGLVLIIGVRLSGGPRITSRESPLFPAADLSITSIPPLRYHAIVIGIDSYADRGPEGWPDLANARADAEAIAATLRDEYDFDVTLLTDREATRERILSALDRLSNFGEQDAVLIYYAGHGFYDKRLGEGFWVPSDARRRVGDRWAKEDWIWNSTLTKVIDASRARHILVICDACYGGSLFRGDTVDESVEQDMTWYRRALAEPSRFLITSGDLEPVLDSGSGHSIFAQAVLNYLRFPDEPIFSASDLGLAIRRKVSALTGQMVRLGPLNVASHAGGEFVFLRREKIKDFVRPESIASSTRTAEKKRAGSSCKDTSEAVLQQAAAMYAQGFTNTARRIL
ncbi:MAG TPA: caspase family protein, partial [Lentisphaerae bacterium]|nr:caspase family protein [Lentisphaerota bacterium]